MRFKIDPSLRENNLMPFCPKSMELYHMALGSIAKQMNANDLGNSIIDMTNENRLREQYEHLKAIPVCASDMLKSTYNQIYRQIYLPQN